MLVGCDDANVMSDSLLRGAEIGINAGTHQRGQRRAGTAGLFDLRQFYCQTADVREHLHPHIRMGRAAGYAQCLHVREAL